MLVPAERRAQARAAGGRRCATAVGTVCYACLHGTGVMGRGLLVRQSQLGSRYRWVAAVGLAAVAFWRFGPFNHRALDRVTTLRAMPAAATVAVPAGVAVDLEPMGDVRDALDHLRISRDELTLRLCSELGGPSTALAQRSHATTLAVAYEVRAADQVDAHHVYLYGVVYERAWDPYGLSAAGFEPVRILIDPLADWGHLVVKVEVKSADGTGSPVEGPYPGWVEAAFQGDSRQLNELVGHD